MFRTDVGQLLTVDGQIPNTFWLRTRLEDNRFGWVQSPYVESEADLTSLPEADLRPAFRPMQAFYVETGVDDAPCESAPDSGLLIQTPEGVAEINMLINEVDIRLHSSAYIQAQAGDQMTINLIEGEAVVSSFGVSRIVPAGSRVRVPIDNDLRASGPPGEVEPYDVGPLAPLPTQILTRVIEPAATLAMLDEPTTVPGLAVNAVETAAVGVWYAFGSMHSLEIFSLARWLATSPALASDTTVSPQNRAVRKENLCVFFITNYLPQADSTTCR
jgi:hypothetical protein